MCICKTNASCEALREAGHLSFHYCLLKHEILLEPHTCFLLACVCFLPILWLCIAYNCSIQFSKFFRRLSYMNGYIHIASSLGRNESELSFRILASRDRIFGTPLLPPLGDMYVEVRVNRRHAIRSDGQSSIVSQRCKSSKCTGL